MKVSSRRSSNAQKILRVLAVTLCLGAALWLFGGAFGTMTAAVTRPFYVARSWLFESSGMVPLYFRERTALIAEMDALKDKVASASGNSATIARLVFENEELERLLHIEDETRIAASVTARPPLLPYDALLIDRGSDDGIKENAIVYRHENRAIGYVSRVYGRSALVTLFSTPGTSVTAYIIGPDIYTTAYGVGGGVLEVTVPQGIALEPGNIVVLPSLEDGVVGTVASVRGAQIEPEKIGSIVSDVPIQSLSFVSIGTREIPTVTFEEARENIRSTKESLLRVDVPPELMVDDPAFVATTTDEAGEETEVEAQQ